MSKKKSAASAARAVEKQARAKPGSAARKSKAGELDPRQSKFVIKG